MISSLITCLLAFFVAFVGANQADEKKRPIIRAIALVIGGLAAISTVYQAGRKVLIVMPAGTVGVVEVFGKVGDRTLPAGVHVVNPFAKVIPYSVRLKDIKETVTATSSEGLDLNIDVSLQYRLEPDKAQSVYTSIGTDEEEIVISRFRSIIREITANYVAKDIYSEKRQMIAQKMLEELQQNLAPLGFTVEEALLRQVILPEKIKVAIEQKLEAEQASQQQQFINEKKRQELDFALEKAQKDAQRQKIEAAGIAEANRLMSQGLSDQILQLKAIEATTQLAESENSKIVIFGQPEDGLPIIWQNQ